MKRALRSMVLPALVGAAGIFAFARPAEAGAFVGFHGPRVSVAIGIGPGPFYPGYVVPAPAAVIFRPNYGYGFWAPAGFGYVSPYWVPVHRFHARWVVSPFGPFFHRPFFGHGFHRPFFAHGFHRPFFGHGHFRGNFHRRW